MATKILAFAGSLRKDSFNAKLVRVAAAGAQAAGADVTTIDLRAYPLPVFDQDLEAAEGLPEAGRQLKTLFREHAGLLIASPEYNSSISAALKNAIDWVSRPEADQPPLVGLAGKVAGIMATSPGGLGGMRGLVHLRAILGNISMLVVPNQVAIPKAHEAFADDGSLVNERKQAAVMEIGRDVANLVGRLG